MKLIKILEAAIRSEELYEFETVHVVCPWESRIILADDEDATMLLLKYPEWIEWVVDTVDEDPNNQAIIELESRS